MFRSLPRLAEPPFRFVLDISVKFCVSDSALHPMCLGLMCFFGLLNHPAQRGYICRVMSLLILHNLKSRGIDKNIACIACGERLKLKAMINSCLCSVLSSEGKIPKTIVHAAFSYELGPLIYK